MKKKSLICVSCKNKIESNNKYYPFCSNRCSKIDLFKWFDNKYFIPKELDFDN